MFTGVVEVGLFCDMAEAAYFGMEVSDARSVLRLVRTPLTNRTDPS
jgi:ribose 5-phosphate isomerase